MDNEQDVLKSKVTAELINETKIALNNHEHFNKEDKKCNEEAITRYLIARELNIPETVEMVIKWQTWRVEFGVDNINAETVKNEIESGKAYFNGFYDKHGRACCAVRPRLHDPSVRDIKECMQYAVYLLEDGINRSEKLGQSDQVCILYDRSGFNYKNFDYQLFTTSKSLVTMLQDNYAERLGALYVIGAGWFYWMIFNIVKVFLTKRTKEKIHLIGNLDELLNHFEIDQLELEYLSDENKEKKQELQLQQGKALKMQNNNNDDNNNTKMNNIKDDDETTQQKIATEEEERSS